ncbi:MAG: FtsH protease activity modulator HflK [Deltaproteobacteria bacterium]|nr:MAG: FtsH protease activity modulator HflK [Deltaproteobacteria bacterium]
MMRRPLQVLAALALLLLAAECVIVVDSDEVAVVFRFGAVRRVQAAGLGLRLPRPIERDTRVPLTEVQRLSLDRRRVLTGDTNLVDISLVAQYTVADPVKWVTGVQDPEALVRYEVDAATVAVVATMGVDSLLTTGRAELQQRLRDDAQSRLDTIDTGVRLVSVDVRELAPPPPVVDAFNDVSSARGDQQTLALAADAYASTTIPDARGQAAARIEEARARASERVERARQAVHRFELLAEEHGRSPRATEAALRTATMQRIGQRVRLVTAPPGAEVEVPVER